MAMTSTPILPQVIVRNVVLLCVLSLWTPLGAVPASIRSPVRSHEFRESPTFVRNGAPSSATGYFATSSSLMAEL